MTDDGPGMTWVDNSLLWIGGVLLVFLGAWLRNFLSILVPGPRRTLLALKNILFPRQSARDRVRFVLGWLDNDYAGSNTAAVSVAFADIEGIELCRSARILSASGAADEWRAAMRRKAKGLLGAWDADIAVVGRVDKDSEALSLWFIRSGDDDTLADTSSNPYFLRFNRLPKDFVDDLNVHVCALALTLAIPKTTDGSRRQRGLHQLKTAVPKLENLFRTLSAPEDRVSLCTVYVPAQSSLGEWLGEPERLRSAIERAEAITKDADIGGDGDGLLTVQVNLARTLHILGEREGNREYIAEAISRLEVALDGIDHSEQASVAAGIEGLAANALRVLGHLEGNPDHLRRAASLLESALDVHRRQEETAFVAISENNLGLVYLDVGQAAKQRQPLERAISLFDSASGIASQENMPTLWAMTQNNTAQAHEALAELGSGSELTELERSRDYYEKAVRGYSRTETPYHLASAKTSLGRVLTKLGGLNGSIDYLDQAIECLEDAYALSSKDPKWTSVGAISAGLGAAFLMRGKIRRPTARDAEKAAHWLEKALTTYDLDTSPEKWVKLKSNLASSKFQLSEAGSGVEAVAQGFSVLEEIFIENDLGRTLAACPESCITFREGIDLIKSMDREAEYVRDWIARWVPVFTEREHEGVPKLILAGIQNDLASACGNFGALPDTVKLCRRALANLPPQDDVEEVGVSSSGVTSIIRLHIKRNLAVACGTLGEELSCAGLLKEAIVLFDEFLKGLDPGADPMSWAAMQSSKGAACKGLYHVEGDVELLRLSLSAYDESLAYLVDGVDSPWHRQVPGLREEVRRLLEQHTGVS